MYKILTGYTDGIYYIGSDPYFFTNLSMRRQPYDHEVVSINIIKYELLHFITQSHGLSVV